MGIFVDDWGEPRVETRFIGVLSGLSLLVLGLNTCVDMTNDAKKENIRKEVRQVVRTNPERKKLEERVKGYDKLTANERLEVIASIIEKEDDIEGIEGKDDNIRIHYKSVERRILEKELICSKYADLCKEPEKPKPKSEAERRKEIDGIVAKIDSHQALYSKYVWLNQQLPVIEHDKEVHARFNYQISKIEQHKLFENTMRRKMKQVLEGTLSADLPYIPDPERKKKLEKEMKNLKTHEEVFRGVLSAKKHKDPEKLKLLQQHKLYEVVMDTRADLVIRGDIPANKPYVSSNQKKPEPPKKTEKPKKPKAPKKTPPNNVKNQEVVNLRKKVSDLEGRIKTLEEKNKTIVKNKNNKYNKLEKQYLDSLKRLEAYAPEELNQTEREILVVAPKLQELRGQLKNEKDPAKRKEIQQKIHQLEKREGHFYQQTVKLVPTAVMSYKPVNILELKRNPGKYLKKDVKVTGTVLTYTYGTHDKNSFLNVMIGTDSNNTICTVESPDNDVNIAAMYVKQAEENDGSITCFGKLNQKGIVLEKVQAGRHLMEF